MLPLVVTVEQVDGGVRRYAFADSPVSVGRSPFAELQLSEPFISRFAGCIRFDEKEITYFNLGETNTAYLDGQSIASAEQDLPLSVNSVLALGDLKLRFSREPVAEHDLRRKGKRRPTRDGEDASVKTVYLNVPEAWSPQPMALAAPAQPVTTETPGTQSGRNIHASQDDSLASQRCAYREARAALLVEVQSQLALQPEAERTAWLRSFMQLEPALAWEPELQAELERRGLRAPQEIPELREWLRAIKGDLLPEHVHFDSHLTLTRVLGLVEALVQSMAEIHDAQQTVRRRWLGRSSRRSPLQSEQGNIVLSYLLNPYADWNERLRELEQSVRDVVSHELALFRATLDGARSLLSAVSPEAVERAESESGEAQTQSSLWQRLFDRNLDDARRWRRFLPIHAELLDGARYERVFLGRPFARSYLAAMGQPQDGLKDRLDG